MLLPNQPLNPLRRNCFIVNALFGRSYLTAPDLNGREGARFLSTGCLTQAFSLGPRKGRDFNHRIGDQMKTMLLVLAAAGSMAMAGAANAQAGGGSAAGAAGADLAKAKGCLNCHAVAEKKVGPAYKDVAAKYKGNKDAAATLTAKLKDGKGHMKVAASDAELKTLVQWALSAK